MKRWSVPPREPLVGDFDFGVEATAFEAVLDIDGAVVSHVDGEGAEAPLVPGPRPCSFVGGHAAAVAGRHIPHVSDRATTAATTRQNHREQCGSCKGYNESVGKYGHLKASIPRTRFVLRIESPPAYHIILERRQVQKRAPRPPKLTTPRVVPGH